MTTAADLEDELSKLDINSTKVSAYFLCQKIHHTVVDNWIHEYSIHSYLIPDNDLEKLGKYTSALLRRQWTYTQDEVKANKCISRLFEVLEKGEIVSGVIKHKFYKATTFPGPVMTGLESNHTIVGVFTVLL